MKIAVFGATGMLGRYIVKEALTRDIKLKVLVRNPAKLGAIQSKVEVVQRDYFNPEDQAKTLEGVDLVISTIGPPPVRTGSPSAQAYGSAMLSLIEAMKEKGLSRIINVAGASASFDGERIQFSRRLIRWIMRLTVPVITPAKELEIKILRSSGLAHTTIRPPMIAESVKGSFQSSLSETPGLKVDAEQLAVFMLDIIKNSDWHGKLPFVATSA